MNGGVSNWPPPGSEGSRQPHSFKTINPYLLVERLADFHEHTEDALIELAQPEVAPAYANYHLALRQKLGERALALATEIRDAFNELGPEPLDQVVPPENMDEALQDFLGPRD